MKTINDIADIECSIHATLEKYKKVWIARTACMYFWESFSDLRSWSAIRESIVEPKDGGFVIYKENLN